jgi:hypothetical protein
VKRRLGKAREATISPTTVALYARALEVRKLGPDFRDEAHAAQADCERALGGGKRRFFVPTVFDVIDHPPDPNDPEWVRAAEQLRRLDEALALAKDTHTVRTPEPEREPEAAA